MVVLNYLALGFQESLGFDSWSEGWSVSTTKQGPILSDTEGGADLGPGVMYEKVFPPGDISLYGNDGGNTGSYLTFVCPGAKALPLELAPLTWLVYWNYLTMLVGLQMSPSAQLVPLQAHVPHTLTHAKMSQQIARVSNIKPALNLVASALVRLVLGRLAARCRWLTFAVYAWVMEYMIVRPTIAKITGDVWKVRSQGVC